jgi:phosphohistidine phosphatase
VVTSPYVRARDTAKIVADALGIDGKITECPHLVPGSDPAEIFRYLAEWKRSRVTLFVGHEPHLGSLASVFVAGRTGFPLEFRKGGLARFDFDEEPAPGGGRLVWWLTPKQLRLLGENGRGAGRGR